jgi:beta-lactamase superfamily II metal-dependent hydrolase
MSCLNSFILAIVALISFSFLGNALALDHNADGVFVRVVDVGAGLCAVVKMPDGNYMIYDAGNYNDGGAKAFKAIKDIIPDGEEVDLLVLSHSDADHLGAVDEICDMYSVKKILRTGFERDSGTWKTADKAIRDETDAVDINLSYFEFPPGATYIFGETYITMVAGFHEPPEGWDLIDESEERNAISIVIRLQYKNKSILFTGDTVGRHIESPIGTNIAAEKFMIDNSEVITIDSDVMIAPHHGANNASSTDFIKAVSPDFVIFSAGHKYQHPRASAVKRYTDNGVNPNNIFRTDLGDDEGEKEWNLGRISNHKDNAGDDDVDILIRPDGDVLVEYRDSQ